MLNSPYNLPLKKWSCDAKKYLKKNEYEVPKNTLKQCNQCFLLLKWLSFKYLKWIENEFYMKILNVRLYKIIWYNILLGHKIFFKNYVDL